MRQRGGSFVVRSGGCPTVTGVSPQRQRQHWVAWFRLIVGGFCLGAFAVTTAEGVAATSPTAQPTLPPAPPSAIGNEFLQWIAVSPAYRHTGLVMALTSGSPTCSKPCPHLWVSRDGGASWSRVAAKNWTPGRFVIANDAKGHDVLYSPATAGVLRSDDDGETWIAAGATGTPTILPTYSTDGGVAVATAGGGADYLIRSGATKTVLGSSALGRFADLQFLPSPEFPNGGSFNPVLLFARDPKSGQPVVFRCSVEFACTGTPTVLPGTDSSNPMSSVATVMSASADYAEQGSVFASTPVGIDKSLDGGATFTPLTVVPVGDSKATVIPMMALASGYREAGPIRTAYAAVMQLFQTQTSARVTGGLYRTIDGGATWSPLVTTGPFEGGAQAVAVAPDGRLFAGYNDAHTHGGLLCSTDGQTWRASCPAVGDHPITASGSTKACSGCPTGNANGASGQSLGAGPSAGAVGVGDTAVSGALPAGTPPSNTAGTGRPTWAIVALIAAVLVTLTGGIGARWRRGRRAGADAASSEDSP